MSSHIESYNIKISLLDASIAQKRSQIDALKISVKSVEGYAIGIKELAANNEDFSSHHRREALDLLSGGKIDVEAYRLADSLLSGISSRNKDAVTDVDKVLLGRQYEINFHEREVETLLTQRAQLAKELEEAELAATIERRREKGARPDQDPSTVAGRAAIDLKARKREKKSS